MKDIYIYIWWHHIILKKWSNMSKNIYIYSLHVSNARQNLNGQI